MSRDGLLPKVAMGALAAALMVPRTAAAADWSRAQSVTVTTTEYRFTPDRLVFKQGVAYRLHIDNRGKEMHEVTAPDFFKTLDIRDPSVLNADRTEIEVPPGRAKDLAFVPRRPGHYDLRCSDHDWAGMVGEITVE